MIGQRSHVARAAGFTLTELMISLVLGLFTISAVLAVLLGGSETFRTTDALSRMQETGRFALELLRRDIREAGYSGCRQFLRAEIPRPAAGVTPLDIDLIRNTLNPAPVGATDNLGFAFNFAEPLAGYEATGDGSGASWTAGDISMPAASANPLVTNGLDNSDILIVVVARGPGAEVTAAMGSPDLAVPIEAGSGIAVGDVVMVSNCEQAAVFQVTQTGTTLAHDVGPVGTFPNGPGNYTTNLGTPFRAGSEIFPIERVAYYVANSPVTGRPALFRNGQEIAGDVEDFQVEYGVDTNGDLRIDQYETAAGMVTVTTFGPPWENVLAVRVHLRISSGEENNLAEQPAVLNYAGVTFTADATDLRLHQVFSTTVGVRNRLQ